MIMYEMGLALRKRLIKAPATLCDNVSMCLDRNINQWWRHGLMEHLQNPSRTLNKDFT